LGDAVEQELGVGGADLDAHARAVDGDQGAAVVGVVEDHAALPVHALAVVVPSEGEADDELVHQPFRHDGLPVGVANLADGLVGRWVVEDVAHGCAEPVGFEHDQVGQVRVVRIADPVPDVVGVADHPCSSDHEPILKIAL
jgi:hypothetical protein